MEQTKKCTKCGEIKLLSEFHKCISNKDGFGNFCKSCRKNISNERRLKNPDKIKAINDRYKLNNIDKVKAGNKKYYEENKEKIKAKRILYDKENYIKVKEQNLRNNEKNRDKIKARQKLKKYNTKRYNNDPQYKLRIIMSSRINRGLKGRSKTIKTIDLLGCSIIEFKQFISKKFLPEMNWDNHGKIWEIDHILPCASFDLNNIEEQKKCFHYSNMQPLFKTTRIAKLFGYDNHIGNRDKYTKII